MARLWNAADVQRRVTTGVLVDAAPELQERWRALLAAYLHDPSADALVLDVDRPATAGDPTAAVSAMIVGLAARADEGGSTDPVPGLLHVTMVATRRSDWGRGSATRLLTTLLERAGSRGFTDAQLWTHAANDRAVSLYGRLGFVRSGRSKVDIDGETQVHLQRRI